MKSIAGVEGLSKKSLYECRRKAAFSDTFYLNERGGLQISSILPSLSLTLYYL
jgi:hypothetical protein